MANWKKPQPEEIRGLRRRLAERARAGELRFPFAVKEIRTSFGMTQTEFASLIGITLRQVREMESGKGNPTLETLNKIGRLFGFSVGLVPHDAAPSATPKR